MGSSRLPGKVLKEICGQPMLWHQLQRVKLAKSLDKIIVATSDKPEDKPITEVALRAGVSFTTGSENDVLDRFYQAVKDTGATAVVRLTGDCPLIDPKIIDDVIETYELNNFDFGIVKSVRPVQLDRVEDFYIYSTRADFVGLNRDKVAK